MTPGKIELQREKTWRLEQTKEDRCLTLARVGMNVDIVKCSVIFFPIFSLAGHFFYFQNKVGHGERGIFAFDYLVGLQTWRGCIDHHVSVGTCLTDLTMMYPAHQTGNTAQAWPLRLCCIRVLLTEHFLLSISLKKKMLTALDKRWTTAQEKAMPRHRRFLSKRSAFFPEKKNGSWTRRRSVGRSWGLKRLRIGMKWCSRNFSRPCR